MARHNDNLMVDDTHRKHSSPSRSPNPHYEAHSPVPADGRAHNNGHENFSRKREFRESRPPYDQSSAKRHRTANWPLPDEEETEDSRRHLSSPTRVSKFHEGSFGDKPSQKPPSTFTRHFNAHVDSSMEEMMDEYHKHDEKPLPPRPVASTLPRGHTSMSPVRQAQTMSTKPGISKWSETNSMAETEDPKSGGFFKFGKSMATAFNPASVWSKMTTGWRNAKGELIREAEEAHNKEMANRQVKAEEAYAQLKQAGKLGSQGSHTVGASSSVFTPGYFAPPVKGLNQRDSGIDMDEGPRTSVDTSKGTFLLPPDQSPSKSQRHHRTPSFQNLKKMASDFSLHRRSASGSMSPEKLERPGNEGLGGMRRSKSRGNVFELFGNNNDASNMGSVRSNSKHSLLDVLDTSNAFGSIRAKKDESKQVKLSKRVSDLQFKLEDAQRELDKALGAPAPVPNLTPTISKVEFRPARSGQGNSLPRSEPRTSSNGSRGFVPNLPTLLSESLLVPASRAENGDDSRPLATMDILHSEDESIAGTTKDDTLNKANGNGFYMQQNRPLSKPAEGTSPPAKENVPDTPESEQRPLPALPTISQEPKTFLADASSPNIGSHSRVASTSSPKKTAKKTAKKTKRVGGEQDDDDDPDWEEVEPKKASPASLKTEYPKVVVKFTLTKPATEKKRLSEADEEKYEVERKQARPNKVSSSPQSAESPNIAGKVTAKKPVAKKRRLSKEEKTYRPQSEDDDDAEWEEAKPKLLKKKCPSDGLSSSPPQAKQTKASRLPVATESPNPKARKSVLTKPQPKDQVSIIDHAHSRTTLREEYSQTAIPVNSSPSRLTAKATPAFPHFHRSPSRSPSRSSRRRLMTPIKKERETRSGSPPPSSNRGKFDREDVVMTAKPNGRDVPPMPGFEEHLKSEGASTRVLGAKKSSDSFVWDEEVF